MSTSPQPESRLTQTAPTTLRLTGPEDVLAAVPHLLGFQPKDALVVLFLVGTRPRLRLTLRLDLPQSDAQEAWYVAVSERMAQGVTQSAAREILMVGYASNEPVDRLMQDLVERVRDAEVVVRDALAVTPSSWRSVLCMDPQCCPPEGRPLPDPSASAVHAALVLHGSAPAVDRAAVLARYDADTTSTLAHRVRESLEDRADAPPPTIATVRERRAMISRIASLLVDGPLTQEDHEAWLDIARGLADMRVRDVMLRRLVVLSRENPEQVRDIEESLRAGGTCLPGPWRTGIMGIVAALAWLRGDGVAARASCDVALMSDPDYSLAHLLHRVMDAGLAPERWIRAILSTSEDACLQGMAA